MSVSKKRKQQQRQATFRLLILAAILVCLNMIAGRFHYGLDLTREKRFTLSPATRTMLKNMKDVAVVNVYLEGKFPAGFQRLQEATRERLQSFKEYAGNKLTYRFIDPFEGKSEIEKAATYQQFSQKGIMPVNLNVRTSKGSSEQMIVPYAIVSYNGKEIPVKLLETHLGMSDKEQLNNSESMLEYKLADAIHKLSLADKPTVAYMIGHGEALGRNTIDALSTLAMHYHVDTFDLSQNIFIPGAYNAIIFDKPTMPFDDKDKFKIDQYVMNGGHILWYLDMVNAPMDSLAHSQQFITSDYGLNLDDLLFKWGVRVNNNLIEDLQCNTIPVQVGMNGDQPQFDLKNWYYLPLFNATSHHPIVNNMDLVMSIFANSIDTIGNPEVKKTVLLASSRYSRTAASPARVTLRVTQFEPRPELFNKGFQPVAVLLEGKFQSSFQNRLAPDFMRILRDSLKRPYKAEADTSGSMIVVGDGDMMQNDFSFTQGPLELGFWRYANPPARYANKDFLLNCVEYLTDQSGVLEARSKDLRLRLLDAGRATKERNMWQALNLGLPILLVLVFASVYLFFRKRRYENKSSN